MHRLFDAPSGVGAWDEANISKSLESTQHREVGWWTSDLSRNQDTPRTYENMDLDSLTHHVVDA